jgi:hypothetical protein
MANRISGQNLLIFAASLQQVLVFAVFLIFYTFSYKSNTMVG